MYACMHVCTYACMHVCMYARMHVCIYACMPGSSTERSDEAAIPIAGIASPPERTPAVRNDIDGFLY
jgi:hypothetical protein